MLKRNLIILFSILFLVISCKDQNDLSDLKTTWYEIKKQDNKYSIVDCGYAGKSFKIKNDSILYHGIMEDSSFKIQRIAKNSNSTSLYIDANEKYEISWIDITKGIYKKKIVWMQII